MQICMVTVHTPKNVQENIPALAVIHVLIGFAPCSLCLLQIQLFLRLVWVQYALYWLMPQFALWCMMDGARLCSMW